MAKRVALFIGVCLVLILGLAGSGTATAATAPGSRVVLLVVRDTILPEINPDVVRLQTDLVNEGYTAKIKSWSTGSASNLWDYLRSEYNTPGQSVSGAILIGNLPTATCLANGQMTDCAFMNMTSFRDVYTLNIWVSRVWATDEYGNSQPGGEVNLIKRYLQVNHDTRTGIQRLPYNVAWACTAYPGSTEYYFPNSAANALEILPTAKITNVGNAMDAANRAGGELMNEESHGDPNGYNAHATTRQTVHTSLVQIRYSVLCSCSVGALGGVVNYQIFTRGGGNIFSVGPSTTAYSGDYMILNSYTQPFRASLAAGKSWGDSMVANYPFNDRYRAMFYGDLSMKVKITPPNQIPTINSFTADKTSGNAPLTVNFNVSASDPEGSAVNYEWFAKAHWYGTQPVSHSGSPSISQTYTLPHSYFARVEVVDNFKARAWRQMEIVVGPTPGQPIRVNCDNYNFSTYPSYGEMQYPNTCYRPGSDYTDAAGKVWLHDQLFKAGTWGVKDPSGNWLYVNKPVANTEDDEMYKTFRSGATFTYRIPVTNGPCWLNLYFADMQSTGAGQRLIDVDAEGVTVLSGLDVYARVGGSAACSVPLYVNVTDGELTFTVRKNAASPADAFLNCFEVLPLAGGNRPPVAQEKSVSTPLNTPVGVALAATDPDGDALTYTVVTQPAHGTLSGVAPNLTYSPYNNYIGSDSFLFKANDGKSDGNAATVGITVMGLLARWNMDEAGGSIAADSSGNGRPAALQGGAVFAAGGKQGNALQLSDADDMAVVSPVVPLAPNWTVAAWFSAPLPATATWHTLARSQTPGDHLIIADASLNLGMYDNATAGQFRGCGYNLGGLSAGWHHVTAVGSGTTTKYYIDGALVGTSDRKGIGDVCYIGNSVGGGQRFSDKIDDVRVYNYALAQAEISALVGAAPNAAPTVATAAAATLPTVKTAALSVLGADDGGETALTYTWATTGTPPAPVTFSVNGANAAKNTTATFTKAGSYTLQATIRDAGGQTVASAVTVTVNPVVTAVTVSPATATISNGATQQFAAAAADQFGAAMSATFSWTVSGGGSINSASGLFTATTAGGPFTVTATAAGRSATASVSVTAVVAGQVAWWKFDETTGAAADSSGNGHTATLQGGAVFATGGKQGNALQLIDANDMAVANPVAPLAASWTVAAWFTAPLPATATWHTLTRSQASSGDHHIIADASLNLGMYDNVTAGQFRSCGYNLGGLSAGWHHVTAVGSGTTTKYYIDGALVGTSDRKGTGDVCYLGNCVGGGQRFSDKIDDVRVYNYALAQAEITALAGAVSNKAPTVATAAAATLPTVKTAALSVLGADDGGEAALTYTWATTGTPPAPVTFSVNGANAAKNTTATFTKAGSYTLQATIRDAGGQTVASAVTVTVNPVVTAVSVTPATASIVNGSTQPFAAVAADQFGAATSATFSWTVTGGGTMNSASGQFTATTVGGPFTVTATAGGKSGTASVTVLKPGSALVVHWKLDESAGTSVADSSGLTNTGVVAGGATWVAGRTNGAVKLDGVDDAVTLGSVKGLGTGSKAHSVAGWIKMNALPSTRAWILQLGNDGSGSHHWLIDRTGKTQFGVWNGAQLQPVLTTGRWTHVAMTYDGTNLVGYVDGTRIGSAAAGFNLQGIPLTVGSPRLSENAFNGTMDDVRVYSRALSAAEVASLVGGVNVTALGMETMPAGGTVQSASASVAVVAESVRHTEEAGFLVSFQGVQGNSYVVEYTDDLLDPAGWHVLSTNTCTSSGTMEVTDNSNGVNRFYRIRGMQ